MKTGPVCVTKLWNNADLNHSTSNHFNYTICTTVHTTATATTATTATKTTLTTIITT